MVLTRFIITQFQIPICTGHDPFQEDESNGSSPYCSTSPFRFRIFIGTLCCREVKTRETFIWETVAEISSLQKSLRIFESRREKPGYLFESLREVEREKEGERKGQGVV